MRVELLSVMPKGTMTRSATPSEIGMLIMEIKVPRQFPRKNSTARPVRSTAITSSSTMFSMRKPTKVERS